MEDIKILEEQLKIYKRHLENYEKEDCLTSTYYELKKYAGALENLIARNKELESALANSVSKDEIRKIINNNKPHAAQQKLQELLNKGE